MQEAIVALVVLYAAWAVAKRYVPRPVRRFVRAWSARMARRAGWHRIAARLEAPAQAAASCADDCSSCHGCDPVKADAGSRAAITPEALRHTTRR